MCILLQRYLKLAQEDKQRYINEMQEFQKSVQFQTYIKNKRRNNDMDTCLTDDGKGLIDLAVSTASLTSVVLVYYTV